MKKLFNRRPSAGLVVGFIALCVALGGGAYAATKKKVEYKGLSKDARLKVLPVSGTNAGTDCDPKTDFTACTSVTLKTSVAFPRRTLLVFDGTFDGDGGVATGDCDLRLDNATLNGTLIKVEAPSHTAEHGSGAGINIVTTPQGGTHTYSVACKETSGDLKVKQFQLSAIMVR
ncbi:MAG: hypothetical protein WB771_13525 [Solirubrobacterales bacterium]